MGQNQRCRRYKDNQCLSRDEFLNRNGSKLKNYEKDFFDDADLKYIDRISIV